MLDKTFSTPFSYVLLFVAIMAVVGAAVGAHSQYLRNKGKTISFLRVLLYAAIGATVAALVQYWQQEHVEQPAVPVAAVAQVESAVPTSYLPPEVVTNKAPPAAGAQPTLPAKKAEVPRERIVHVMTDVLDVEIDTLGGNLIQSQLLKYPEKLNEKSAFLLLNDQPDSEYIARSGLLSALGPDNKNGEALYKSAQQQYVMQDGQNDLVVKLTWRNSIGIQVTKLLTFHRDSYEVDVNYQIENHSNQQWTGNLYNQLIRTGTTPADGQGFSNLTVYYGAAISSPEKPFLKIPFKEMKNKNLNQTIKDGWAAMIQHYFVSAWIPDKDGNYQYFSKVTPDGLYEIGMVGSPLSIPPQTKGELHAKLYSGPSITDRLKKAAPGLDLTVDYGIFWFIASPIFWILQKVNGLIGNWGWSIIITTLIIKLLLYKLADKSYHSMGMMKKMQPRLERLKEIHGDNRQKLNQAMMDLYRQEKVNPAGGCLPMLLQIPVFISIYWVLIESVQLRQAPWILWIYDLSAKDPYYVLPVLVGLSTFLQQRLSPPPADPMQAKMMMLLPIVFTVMFLNFPAGLMLYWFVNNMTSNLHQWYVTQKINGRPGK